MASISLDNFDFPHFPPPPPPNNPVNPHPHPLPPPTPVVPTPPPSPDHQTVIIIVVISFGCLLLLGAILLCMWWWFIKRRKETRKHVHERKDIEVDEHLRVQEMIVRGCCGRLKTVLVSVDDDVRVHEDVHKDEVDMVACKGVHGNSKEEGSSQQLSLPQRQV